MERRLKDYLAKMAAMDMRDFSQAKCEAQARELLTQIGFFQHERLIHLIVTVTFAVLTLISIGISFQLESLFGFLLPCTFLILLIPYIRHYYILENGVQELYRYYDALAEKGGFEESKQ